MIKFRINRQFLAMRGERLARLAPGYLDGATAPAFRSATAGAGASDFLSLSSPAGKQAAPQIIPSPPCGAATPTTIGVDLGTGDMTVFFAILGRELFLTREGDLIAVPDFERGGRTRAWSGDP